jgi:glucosamine kinase
MYDYLIGVDGGGTGTRVRIERADGVEVGRGSGGPSGLINGRDKAWASVMEAVQVGFASAQVAVPPLERIAIGLGLAGVHNKQWAAEFEAKNPGFGAIVVETDAFSTVLGAHLGKPGAIIALGTGSVGEAFLADGTRREVGGWGFPAGDEAGGAWMGLRAINHVEQVLDGRQPENDFGRDVIAFCGGDRHGVMAWVSAANQAAYAQLAPLVIQHAATNDFARSVLVEAGKEVAKIGDALDPTRQLPIALCGGLGEPLRPHLPEALLARIIRPQADSAAGALILIRHRLQGKR